MKKIFRTIHLYLGLASGLVITVVCMTGTIMVFEKEMQELFYPERYFVSYGQQEEKISLDQILSTVTETLPKAELTSVKIYSDPARTIEIIYSDKKPKDGNEKFKKSGTDNTSITRSKDKVRGKERKEVKQLFINPYTGNTVASFSLKNAFFKQVEMIHRKLLAEEIGKQIVGASVAAFVLMLITGIILWWPKNKNILKQRLKIKINGSWKRTNHDLHVVIGFYCSIVLFIIALTGLTFSYQWMGNAIHKLAGTENTKAVPFRVSTHKGGIAYQSIYQDVLKKYPQAQHYVFKIPHELQEAVAVSVLPEYRINENAKDVLYYDGTNRLVDHRYFKDLNLGDKIKSALLPIHKGNIGGLPGKIIVLFAALAGCTFPITGVILWINRLKKEKNKSKETKREKEILLAV